MESYLPVLDCTKSVDKNWNINISFIIHVNFDHVWAGHYSVTLRLHPTTQICAHAAAQSPAMVPSPLVMTIRSCTELVNHEIVYYHIKVVNFEGFNFRR